MSIKSAHLFLFILNPISKMMLLSLAQNQFNLIFILVKFVE
jgi:hypothetical protein